MLLCPRNSCSLHWGSTWHKNRFFFNISIQIHLVLLAPPKKSTGMAEGNLIQPNAKIMKWLLSTTNKRGKWIVFDPLHGLHSYLFMHPVVFCHCSHCVSSGIITLITSWYSSVRIMDRNPGQWHHCHILISSSELRELHSFFCFLKWAFRCLSVGRSPAAKTVTVTRSTVNCKTPRCRSKFGNFSFHGADHWSLSAPQ